MGVRFDSGNSGGVFVMCGTGAGRVDVWEGGEGGWRCQATPPAPVSFNVMAATHVTHIPLLAHNTYPRPYIYMMGGKIRGGGWGTPAP